MNESDKPVRDLYQIWMRIMNKLNESENLPRIFGIEIPLFPSEIHTIQVIGDHPESNVRAVADILGITPGAASQTITKLAKRELVKKVRGKRNEKEVHLELTPTGLVAYNAHESIHEMVFQRISGRIGHLTDNEISLINHILNAVESVYDERIAEIRQNMGDFVNNDPEMNS
jgi:DNA-binding MarR family transcriptional regulator